MVADSDRFWLLELRVSRHFSTFYGSSVQAMDTQLNALPALPVLARTVSGCLNSAFLDISQHFTAHLFRPWIPGSARGIDGGSRRFTEVVPNEQSPPVASMKSSRSQDATFCDSAQNLVGSHSGRRHPGIDGSPNQRNKSDRKENTRQPKLCSMPPQGCKVRRARLKISSSGICRGSTADGSAMRLVTTPSRIRWN